MTTVFTPRPALLVTALAGLLFTLVPASSGSAQSAAVRETTDIVAVAVDTVDSPAEEAVGAATDSLPPFLMDAPPDTLPPFLTDAPRDTLPVARETAAPAADTMWAAAEEPPPLSPRGRTVPGLAPEVEPQFARPWTLREIGGPPGVGASELRIPGAALKHGPFERETVIDLEEERLLIILRSGENTRFVSYAAPIEEFRRVEAERRLRAAWHESALDRLGKGVEQREGLLDIDIPVSLPGPFAKAIGPGANLKVRGSERITFGGQTNYVVGALDQESGPPNRWPQLDMQQELTVNLEGTIGRKIHVYVDHRSGGDTFGASKSNQIKVHYDGDEDEIIQKIELGEVNLSLPGTEFVSYSGSHEGLFGAKMLTQLGKLDVVSIASKEEGQSSSANFTGTSESDSLIIQDTSYRARTFFAIDGDVLKYSNYYLESVSIYVDDRDGSNDIETGAVPGRAYLDEPVGGLPPAGGPHQRGVFDELVELEDYEVDYGLGIIEFYSSVPSDEVVAVAYTRSDGHVVGGQDAGGDTLRLKMIKLDERVNGTEWEPTRVYELKNVYDLGAHNIPEEGFELVIKKRSPSGEVQDVQGEEPGTPYIRILGLDQQEPFDEVDHGFIDFEKGYLYFPNFTPFCPDYDDTGFYPDSTTFVTLLEEENCKVYSEEVFDPDDDIYFIQVKYNRPKTTFSLGRINIIENSEVVRLNGVKLTRGVDYTIYYPAGQLTLLTEEAKDPDARVTVEYDYKPFGFGGEKTLLGTRAVYNWSENIHMGTTWMYQSKGTPEDRPRLGEEPSRTIVGDMNMRAEFSPGFMTRMADAVPLVDTEVESSLKIAVEAAVSIPNPNTKGFVSVDDMEGVENVSMLGVTRRLWVPASLPVDFDAGDRVGIDWYNPPQRVNEGDLYPNLPSEEANDSHTVLEIDHDSQGGDSWAGLMRLLSKTGHDYSDHQFVEVWVNDAGYEAGELHIDLGTISEDFYPLSAPNDTLDTEDVDRNGFDADEDTGLDTVEGADGAGVSGDDGDDDYSYTYGDEDYSEINGTEGNERLDTEDLNGNWYLDTDNKYWTMTVDLSDSPYLVQDNGDIETGNHWKLYRIPLEAAEAVNGIGDWTIIKSARISFRGLPENGDPIMIGSLDVVGNQWEPGPIRTTEGAIVPTPGDESFKVDQKSTKEDPDYDPPFDVGIDDETNLPEREQSLVLLYENLRGGHQGQAKKVFYDDENYTGYQGIEFYVHGESGVEDETVFFVRIGADTVNYYEYSFEVREGWKQDLGSVDNRMTIPFTAFTDLKLGEFAEQDTASVSGDVTQVREETFTRVGWPSFSRVRRLEIGVRNADPSDTDTISGEIWVDDVRLIDVRKDMGWAERATVDAKFADLAKINFDLRHVDGEFHTLKQQTGSGQDNLTYNITGSIQTDKFVSGLGIATPVTVNWKKAVTRPKFSSGSDIVLDSEQSEDEKTEVLDRSISASFSRKRQSQGFWTHLLLDGLSLRSSVSNHRKTSPTGADTSQTIRGSMNYRYSPSRDGIRLFRNTKLFLKPTNVRLSADTHLTHTMNYEISSAGVKSLRSNKYDKRMDVRGSVDFSLLDNLDTSHSASSIRDLDDINRPWAGLNIGHETERHYSNSLNFSPKFGNWLSPHYSFSSSFDDNHDPSIRRTDDPFGVRNVRGNNRQEIRMSFDMKKLFGTGGVPGRGGRAARTGGPKKKPVRQTGEEAETPGEGEDGSGEGEESPEGGKDDGEEEEDSGPGFAVLADPVLNLFRRMDAIDGKYSVKRTSRYNYIPAEELPDWLYRLGLSGAEDADERTEERVFDLGSGVKLTNEVRIKGSYKRTMSSRWSRNSVSDSVDVLSRTEGLDEATKGSLSWSGVERIGPLSNLFKSVRARSGVEYKRSYSGPADDPATKGNTFGLSPLVSLDATFKNGLSGSFSWDRKRARTYTLSGAGSVTENTTGTTSVTLNYRFSAPQGLKLPFFGQKLRFQSNLDTSLTFRTSSKTSVTALDEPGLLLADPSSSTRDFSVTADATYSFSRSVSGGLQISFSQNKDVKTELTRRSIGVHLTAEFKF